MISTVTHDKQISGSRLICEFQFIPPTPGPRLFNSSRELVCSITIRPCIESFQLYLIKTVISSYCTENVGPIEWYTAVLVCLVLAWVVRDISFRLPLRYLGLLLTFDFTRRQGFSGQCQNIAIIELKLFALLLVWSPIAPFYIDLRCRMFSSQESIGLL